MSQIFEIFTKENIIGLFGDRKVLKAYTDQINWI